MLMRFYDASKVIKFSCCSLFYPLYFLAPVYVIIPLQYSRGVVRPTEVFRWHSCSVMARVVKCVSNFLIICHWTHSIYMIGSNNILFVLSVFGEVEHLWILVYCVVGKVVELCVVVTCFHGVSTWLLVFLPISNAAFQFVAAVT